MTHDSIHWIYLLNLSKKFFLFQRIEAGKLLVRNEAGEADVVGHAEALRDEARLRVAVVGGAADDEAQRERHAPTRLGKGLDKAMDVLVGIHATHVEEHPRRGGVRLDGIVGEFAKATARAIVDHLDLRGLAGAEGQRGDHVTSRGVAARDDGVGPADALREAEAEDAAEAARARTRRIALDHERNHVVDVDDALHDAARQVGKGQKGHHVVGRVEERRAQFAQQCGQPELAARGERTPRKAQRLDVAESGQRSHVALLQRPVRKEEDEVDLGQEARKAGHHLACVDADARGPLIDPSRVEDRPHEPNTFR